MFQIRVIGNSFHLIFNYLQYVRLDTGVVAVYLLLHDVVTVCILELVDDRDFFVGSGLRRHLLVIDDDTPGKSIGASIANLYDEMDKLVGEGMNVNIEQDNGRLYFNLWKCHKWGELTLYYFPMKFVESLNSTLRRISITFINKLMWANGISTILDEEDTDYIFMWLKEDDSQEEEEETVKRLELVRSYEKGKIGRLLKHVEKKSYYKDLPKALEKYTPQNDFERSIVGAMKKGLPFLNPEHGIMQYGYDAFYEEEPDFQPMRLDQQIRVVYDCDDMVSEYLVDYYNNNSQETYDIIPITTCALSPETDRLFIMDDYPERFFKWADEFINIVY